ncbi:ParB/RepB/Spo0J family partition protein [Pseudonocardia abyssalis]|uniref:ParB N-terminal domain-containing protein n=1 Tax=Pseudonocardia abyssalis TaxID=2792008 RepID=A0ABS6URV5_9PSEU|nr:ParB/RepB/Spo0J family partition protein [Pseudonocardia abyssalis]MBW0115666.1 ParB N-terminal domain-containing protein [Pseudonocardia abyssalis]MBW0134989.1 ParB N-terminal domain-containing protein [Pseudonocardia abyssalis]
MTITDLTQDTDNIANTAAVPDDPAVASDTTTAGDSNDIENLEADPSVTSRPDAEIGVLVAVDPRILVVGVNVRRDLALDKPFLRSIAERGVREPIIARRAADGALVVRKGKRRTVAAVEVGRASVPVLVEPGSPDTDDVPDGLDRAAREMRVERIVDQLEENQHRTGTSDTDEVHAHQQLLDLGLTAGQIARRTHVPTARVKVTTAVARSELAAAVLDRYEVTLDQAAVIAEFDDHTDAGTDAVKVLTVTAAKNPAQFDHVAQKLRDERADAALLAEAVVDLTGQGLELIDPDQPGDARQISGLRPSEETPSGTELTAEAHTGCPGRAASVEVRRGFDRQPQLRIVHWCLHPDMHGHAARWTQLNAGGDRTGTSAAGNGGAGSAGALSEEEKAQRRLVIANNREWDSATTVRRQWLRTFLARKSPPRNAAVFIAATLGRAGHDLRRAMESGHPTALEVLGHDPVGSVYTGRPHPITEAAATASPQRATQLTLAVLLGAAEDATNRQTWRSPEPGHRAYFTALRDWGYPLSPVEQLVVPDPDQPGDDRDDAERTDGSGDAGPVQDGEASS